jgi:serine/threonine protein kinase
MSGGELTEYIRMNPSADRIGLVGWNCTTSGCDLRPLQLCGIANGLSYLHSCGVIHGDLKGVCGATKCLSDRLTRSISQASLLMIQVVHA